MWTESLRCCFGMVLLLHYSDLQWKTTAQGADASSSRSNNRHWDNTPELGYPMEPSIGNQQTAVGLSWANSFQISQMSCILMNSLRLEMLVMRYFCGSCWHLHCETRWVSRNAERFPRYRSMESSSHSQNLGERLRWCLYFFSYLSLLSPEVKKKRKEKERTTIVLALDKEQWTKQRKPSGDKTGEIHLEFVGW